MKPYKRKLYKRYGTWILDAPEDFRTFKSFADAWAYIWGDVSQHCA